MEGFFSWLGQLVGSAIRVLLGFLHWLFAGVEDFFTGLAGSLGISASVVSLLFLFIGLYLLYSGFRQFFRRKLVSGILRIVLGVLLLGWLIN